MECQQIYVEENIIGNVDKWIMTKWFSRLLFFIFFFY